MDELEDFWVDEDVTDNENVGGHGVVPPVTPSTPECWWRLGRNQHMKWLPVTDSALKSAATDAAESVIGFTLRREKLRASISRWLRSSKSHCVGDFHLFNSVGLIIETGVHVCFYLKYFCGIYVLRNKATVCHRCSLNQSAFFQLVHFEWPTIWATYIYQDSRLLALSSSPNLSISGLCLITPGLQTLATRGQ